MKKFIILILAVLVLSVTAQAGDWQLYKQYTVTTNYAGTYNITNEWSITQDSVDVLKLAPSAVGFAPPYYTGNVVVTYYAVAGGTAYKLKSPTNVGTAAWVDTITYPFRWETNDVLRVVQSPAPGASGMAGSNTTLTVNFAQP